MIFDNDAIVKDSQIFYIGGGMSETYVTGLSAK